MRVTTWPWRIRTGTLMILVACVVVPFVLTMWIIQDGDEHMQVIANAVNLFGAVLTFAGLLYAYVRSDVKLRAWWQRAWARVSGRPLPIPSGGASGTYGWAHASASAAIGFSFKGTEDRTDQLLGYINQLSRSVGQAEGRIGELQRDLERAKEAAEEGDQEVRAHADSAVRRLAEQHQATQILDLRWAIAGVFFSAFGAVLNFYA